MNNYLNKHKRTITRQILAVFVISWFSLIGQSNAHSFMMLEMQEHKSMGHEMAAHCQPVLCETVISLDNQTSYGLASVSILDFNDLPVIQVSMNTSDHLVTKSQRYSQFSVAEFYPPPLQKSGILRI